MADRYEVTPDSHPDSPERWQSAYARALKNELTIRPGLFGTSMWTVSSASNPGLAYATDGDICGCLAAERQDPVCLHRALVRKIEGRLPEIAAPSNVVSFIHRRHEPLDAA